LLQSGAYVTGIDLSLNMMGKLRQKYPAAHLTQADASRLPFAMHQFDAVLTTHVMHLIGPWREALREYRCVLKPDGVYIDGTQWHDGSSLLSRIRDQWRDTWLRHMARNGDVGRADPCGLDAEVQRLGGQVETVEVLRYYATATPRERLDQIHSRVCSDAWDVSDEVFEATFEEITAWTRKRDRLAG
jgi:SAM-dependent methyltransferase